MINLLIFIFLFSLIMILHTYIGYQIFLAILSHLFKKKHTINNNYFPTISLITVVHDEEKFIKVKIKNCIELNYPSDRLELIFIDDCSEDNTYKLIDSLQNNRINIIRQKTRKGKSAAINVGLKQAHGKIIVISDGNSLMNKESLKMIARHFEDENIGAVGGKYEPKNPNNSSIAEGSSFYWKYERYMKQKESDIDSIIGMNGNISAFRKGILKKIPEDLLVEDFDMTIAIRKKGFRIIYEPQSCAWKLAPENLEDELIQKKRRVIGTIQSLIRHKNVLFNPKYGWYGSLILPSHKLFQMLMPFFILILFISSLVLNYINFSMFAILYYLIWIFLMLGILSVLYLYLKPNSNLNHLY